MRYLMPAVLSIAGLVAFGCDAPSEGSAKDHVETALLSADLASQSQPVDYAMVMVDSLPMAMRGVDYVAALQSDKTPDEHRLIWKLLNPEGMPAGLTLVEYGYIGGTPQEAGLHTLQLLAQAPDGTEMQAALDLVIHEGFGYAHQPDQFDTAGFDDAETYASLGQLNQGDVFTQAKPLSVTSDDADPNTNPRDFLLFNTDGGDIQVSVFFAAQVGQLKVMLMQYTDDGFAVVAKGLCDNNGDNAHLSLANAPAGEYALMVEAVGEGRSWNANGYTFRIKVGVPQLSLQTSESLVDLVNARPAR